MHVMKNLVLSMGMLTALGTGCVVEDDGGVSLLFLVTCPPDASSFSVDVDGDPESASCDSGELEILVDPGTYDVVVTPTSGSFDFASDFENAFVVRDGDDLTLTFDEWPTGGFFALDWTIDDQDADAAACDDLGSTDVSALATVVGSTQAFETTFDCADGGGTSDEVPPDDFTMVVALLNDAGESIADSEPRTVSIEVEGQLERLGTFNFTTN
jgi:hypothetical protein